MAQKFYRLLWLAGLLLFAAWQSVACHQTTRSISQTDCYLVKHTAGTTCVLKDFKRVVTLDLASFENAIALGINPVGTAFTDLKTHFPSLPKKIVNIGKAGEPNLESILALKPDLILGFNYHQSFYSQAQQIAPTVLFRFDHSGQWKEIFQAFAIALDREAIAKQVMADYEQRLATFKQHFTEENQLPPSVSIVRVYPEKVNLYLRESFPGTVVEDAGLPRPVGQDLSAAEAQKTFNNPIQVSISQELLTEADADVMFLWTGENTAEANEKARARLATLKSDPLWQQLNVVQANQVYQVPDYWIGSGPIAANAIVDDLFKYLVSREN